MSDRVFQCAFEPAYEALVDGGWLERAATGQQIGEPAEEVFPEAPYGIARPISVHVVTGGCVNDVCGTLDMAFRVRHALHVRVEQDELTDVPGETVPNPIP